MTTKRTAAHEEFRHEFREWLEENRPESIAPIPYTREGFESQLAWERTLFDAGYAAPSWPESVGGMGADAWTQLVFDEECVKAGLPERLNKLGLVHGGPSVIAHGTQEQKDRWLKDILTCEEIWCQGFSEPDAGSDLASLKTRGEVRGDSLLINGSKIWTSHGTIATKMFALVRTDPDSKRSKGISFVIVDLDSPGVEVRPLRQLHGQPGFAEVHFTNVSVPLSNVVGEIGEGWAVAQTSLRLERGAGRGNHTRLLRAVDNYCEAVARSERRADRLSDLGEASAWAFAFSKAVYFATAMQSDGTEPGAFPSILKLCWSETQREVYDRHLNLLGPHSEFPAASSADGAFGGLHRDYWHARASEIFAGTSEIQRNIIAETDLGLPRGDRS